MYPAAILKRVCISIGFMKKQNIFKICLLAGITFVYANPAKAEKIINWFRSNGGRHGYKTVNQVYFGKSETGNDQIYNVTCQDPGREPCKFAGYAANPNSVDDWAVNLSRRFFDDMNDFIDRESETKSSGSWAKTIESVFQGQDVKIYMLASWIKDESGTTRITTKITPVYK